MKFIDDISQHLPENQAKIVYETDLFNSINLNRTFIKFGLEYLDDAEAYEPEFNEPNTFTLMKLNQN